MNPDQSVLVHIVGNTGQLKYNLKQKREQTTSAMNSGKSDN